MGTFLRCASLVLALSLLVPGHALADATQDFREGMTAASKGDLDTAMAAFNRIISSNADGDVKNLASAYNWRGLCYEAKNELQLAMADYTKAIEIDVKMAEAYANRSLLYMKLGDESKAREDATAAKRIDRKVKVPNFDK
jgi:tetratricopeptide (TPR) repeat protein